MLSELKITNSLLLLLIASMHVDKIPMLGHWLIFMGAVLLCLSVIRQGIEYFISKGQQ